MLIWVYRLVTYIVAPLFWLYQRRLIKRGREEAAMGAERWGRASLPRPKTGKLVWIHAASVGETLAIFDLVEQLLAEDDELHILVTTFTQSAGRMLRKTLPPRAMHQLLPFEYRPAIDRFLRHWQPDLAVWTESELWPAVLDRLATHRPKLPRVMVNGKITEKSFSKIKRYRRMMAGLLGGFDWAQVQSARDKLHYEALGMAQGRIEVVGSVKEAAPVMPFNGDELARLRAEIGARPCWLAASTHPEEFEQVYAAHAEVRNHYPEMTLIHAPRHPDAGEYATEAARTAGLSARRRGLGEGPDAASVYICDTLGEMGLWHRLALICFVGGSLCDKLGHNPFEAVALQNALIHGPSIGHFEAAYRRYLAAGAAIEVNTAKTLADAVLRLMNPDLRQAQIAAANAVRQAGEQALARTKTRLAAHIQTVT
jgi:3-deoxy-D-manno-octulosonic-acid transferase